MVDAFNLASPPSYIDSTRLVITEVDREIDYLEVTYFGEDSGILEQSVTVTNILGDSLEISADTVFNSGETKEFTSPLSGTSHLQLIALDATNPAFWVNALDDSNKGYFFDERVIANPLPDVPQGEIAIGLKTVSSGLSHFIGIADPKDGTRRI